MANLRPSGDHAYVVLEDIGDQWEPVLFVDSGEVQTWEREAGADGRSLRVFTSTTSSPHFRT